MKDIDKEIQSLLNSRAARSAAMRDLFNAGTPFNHAFDEVCKKGELNNPGLDRSGYKLKIKNKKR